MAEKALQQVKDELTTCSICLDTYTDPKLLQCFHVYCQGCLEKLVLQDQQGQLILTCPNCRQVTPVPGGVAGLQPAFHINRLLGIIEEHRNASIRHCTDHLDEELKLYCETCGKLICLTCAYIRGEHHDHNHAMIDEAFEKYKEEISLSLQPVEKQMATIKQAQEQLHTCRGKINDQQAAVEAEIHSSIEQFKEKLEVRKMQLLDQLNEITQSKLNSLASQESQLETSQAQLGSCLDFMKKSMETDCRGDVLKMKTSIVSEVSEITAPFQPDFLTPCVEANLLYMEPIDSTDYCQNFGRLSDQCIDPSKCYATGDGLEEAMVEKETTVLLHATNGEGGPGVQPISVLECELVSETLEGTRVLGRAERIEQSKYEISYRPTLKGRHNLHIKVKGQHIRGSPFSVAVKSSIQKLGTPFHSIMGVNGPYGVALTHKQELVVSGYRDHCIHVFNLDGKKLLSFGSHGSGRGQFQYPMGVAVDKDENILVVDSANNRVQKFTSDGQFLVTVGTKGSKRLQFDRPCGIAFNTSNSKVYIADTFNNRVQVLNSNLTFSSSFGELGHRKGQLTGPFDLKCAHTGEVYIADKYNHRIQVFSAKGRFKKVLGKYGEGEGELNSPVGMALDHNGMVYVTEDGNHRVSVFTPEGEFVKAFGGEGNIPGQFQEPRGLVVDSNGVVCVCDCSNDRMQMF